MKEYNIAKFTMDNLTFKTYPKPGYDVYEIKIYWKGGYLATVEADGMEVEMFRHKDNPDPDSYTYDELEKACEDGIEALEMETPLQRKTRLWKEGLNTIEEDFRKIEREGWD